MRQVLYVGVVKLKETNCPCESGRIYAKCCAPFHQGAAAETAEQLMRSRYSAFVLNLHAYLLATWHSSTRPATLGDEEPVRWIGLKIKDAQTQALHAEVEFIARYKVGGKAWKLHERSRFVFEEGRWYYIDGDMLES
ncbi:YchJ family protein [Janthinobacterium sp. B9-8]|uniref:YchJ family protein n=1 Tax=Janthinobacterium sp. B9-8 TaxID=1236179 RepID=UPI00061D25BD|nr:hypothetical protein VN23_08650 [Janthinobacterium sp. B9-8]